MAYERFQARVDNPVRLRRNFFDNGIIYDPYRIPKIEIWSTRYDPEYETEFPGSLLKDTLYGSRMLLLATNNSAYGELGLEAGEDQPSVVTLTEYEESFINETSIIFTHNLGDRTPIVTLYDATGVMIMPDTITSLDASRIQVTFSLATSGDVDIVGAVPIGASTPVSLVKKYTQSFSNETYVVVDHMLNDDLPNVVIYDGNYNVLYPDQVQFVDSNTIALTFVSPQSGQIIVTGGNTGYASVGFGCQAKVLGTRSETFDTHTGENDSLLISVDAGIAQPITLTQRFNAQANDIISQINAVLAGAKAYLYDGNKIQIISDSYGDNASIELQVVANSAYTSIGLAQGIYRGLGYAPAETTGTRSGDFVITDTSKWFSLSIDGGANIDIDLLEGDTDTKHLNANQIAAIINVALSATTAVCSVSINRELVITATTTVEVLAIANDAYTQLGFTVGFGAFPNIYTGSNAETFQFDATNNNLTIVNNYQSAVYVTLTTGSRTINDVVAEINAVFTANSIDAVAEESVGVTGGRLILRSLTNNGILRIGVGQYYVDYMVPTNFVSSGVLNKNYLDVWYYAPVNTWATDIADDTSFFVVYAGNYFLDTGFSNYDFAFTLLRDVFWKGENRVMQTKVVALPKYASPIQNDWILPLADVEYQIQTSENTMIQTWTPTSVNSGSEIRVQLDTTQAAYRDGLYKFQLKVNLPNSEVIMSPNMSFRITNK